MAQKIDYGIAAPERVELDMGRRLKKLRLSGNVNQTTLARNAGVSRRTVTRLENGEGVSLDTLIRVMKALGVADRLQELLPDPAVRPIERIRLKGRERQHARETAEKPAAAWTWNDGSDKQ